MGSKVEETPLLVNDNNDIGQVQDVIVVHPIKFAPFEMERIDPSRVYPQAMVCGIRGHIQSDRIIIILSTDAHCEITDHFVLNKPQPDKFACLVDDLTEELLQLRVHFAFMNRNSNSVHRFNGRHDLADVTFGCRLSCIKFRPRNARHLNSNYIHKLTMLHITKTNQFPPDTKSNVWYFDIIHEFKGEQIVFVENLKSSRLLKYILYAEEELLETNFERAPENTYFLQGVMELNETLTENELRAHLGAEFRILQVAFNFENLKNWIMMPGNVQRKSTHEIIWRTPL